MSTKIISDLNQVLTILSKMLSGGCNEYFKAGFEGAQS